ncbi:type II secretion system GspH family protein [Bombilactobacillus folatiphilus]|uniref:Type II secretion system GspH family protein n=1 Tax=Bombilactobacillus folatiphilus TaxID=2923362 RepID=A0ABY4PA24_9LACO|nr:type II secretion system protein [Bombilactobacillus folatiphilus]UQS82496.1 type II secretion system GspH family protein [Bombilactobacillus folatiphilus]
MELLSVLRNKHAAFTLIEAVISLGIICTILLLPANDYRKQQINQQEKLALTQFEYYWRESLKVAFLNQKPCTIVINNTEHKIYYESASFTSGRIVQNLPKTMTSDFNTNQGRSLEFKISGKGTVSPASIYFYTTKKRYKYTIQMLWGQLIAQKST